LRCVLTSETYRWWRSQTPGSCGSGPRDGRTRERGTHCRAAVGAGAGEGRTAVWRRRLVPLCGRRNFWASGQRPAASGACRRTASRLAARRRGGGVALGRWGAGTLMGRQNSTDKTSPSRSCCFWPQLWLTRAVRALAHLQARVDVCGLSAFQGTDPRIDPHLKPHLKRHESTVLTARQAA
jgi:hypothetical protein